MIAKQTSNFIPELDSLYLDADKDTDTVVEVICRICGQARLTISGLARAWTTGGEHPMEYAERLVLNRSADLYAHGFERTVIFPCGHIFGDRCVREKLINQNNPRRNLTCPSCGFQMIYEKCGHAIVPALICASGSDSIRDSFPLTIPEGGQRPNYCKECRWRLIREKLGYTLNSVCVMCTQEPKMGIPEDPMKHGEHRRQHVQHGIRDGFRDIMMLVQPDFTTRETENSAQKAKGERDQRNAKIALLNVMALTELEETVWYRTATTERLREEQYRQHMAGVQAIEYCILSFLMGSGEKNSRRMW
ncbi:hypothetical protein F4861DRAFT_489020 [Xylaria intraflava]|nr:hypothetical protein F4861DRAFT_489020 [Xylaria intraflava]